MKKRIGCFVAFLIALSIGCAQKNRGYPDVTAVTIDQSTQPCHQCGRTINSVSKEHTLALGAAKYIVCSEECRIKQTSWHESQFGK